MYVDLGKARNRCVEQVIKLKFVFESKVCDKVKSRKMYSGEAGIENFLRRSERTDKLRL